MLNNQTRIILICIILMISGTLKSQTKEERKAIQSQSHIESLQNLKENYAKKWKAQKEKALRMAKENGWEVRKTFEGGEAELMSVTEDGRPVYYITHNSGAAESVSTDRVHPGGVAGLSLDGTGMTAGEWDGGDVRTTHQEFNNTGSARVTDMDGDGSDSYHATHVAGTIIAGGVQSSAKGMAYNGNLEAYDWNSDNSEMAGAAADGLLLSNHSYGYITGWYWNDSFWEWWGDETISTEEDYHFGFYGSKSQAWDQIAYDAPYYLIVKSAGNDRGDGTGQAGHPPDGGADGFDCIGWQGNAKNILTVGATLDVEGGYSGNPDDVEMTTFSSWGPSDDGRIKPDISGNGYYLFSTDNESDDDYTSLSGTSMSAPNLTGSLLLLQEHYNDLNSNYMKSATLKGVAIHTADECGPDEGPDYMFGWGLLNTQTAADIISMDGIESLIQEETLNDGDTFTLDVTPSTTEPLIVTVVWTDVPGTPVSAQLDPTDPMLVNDLDVTVTETVASTTHYPYMLDGQNPSAAATTGNNDVDNVEKVYIENPTANTYTIEVSHEGTLDGGSQDFSIIISGISMGYPVVATGDVTGITMTTADVSGEVISENGNPVTERGFVYNQSGNPTIADNTELVGSGSGSFSTTLDGLQSANTYYVRAFATNSEGTSYGETVPFNTLCDIFNTLPFTEDFSENTLPTCWENIDNDGSGQTWQFVTGDYILGGDQETFNSTTESNGFAVLDSNNYGSGGSQDADMITPLLDLSTYTEVTVSFEHYFRQYGSSTATFSYSTDGGSSWTDLQSWSGTSTNNPETWTQDLSAEIGGESAVKLKWNYTGAYDWYWAVDDFSITGGSTCTPPTTQASGFSVNDINDTEVTISWTRGDGDAVLVVAKQGGAVDALPVDGSAYTASAVFGAGDMIGSENYVVYADAGNSVTITGLTEGTDYHFAVFEYFEGSYCYLTPALTGNTTTTGTPYCESYATETGFEYISNVSLEDIDNDSGDSGYSDFTAISTDLIQGQSYQISADATDGFDSDEFWGWIDWNQDGDFLDASETIFFDYTAINGDFTATADIVVPADAVLGTTLMRISLADGGTHSCGIFSYGEVEDYTLNITEALPEHTVTFNVSDINTSDPISGAEISIDGENLTTDASGQASISLTNGTFSYSVTATGYENTNGSVTVSGTDVTENVEMTPLPPEEYTVTFNVSDIITSDPISGAVISVNGQNLTTDASGQATISLPDGTYSYSVTASEYENESGTVTVSGADITENVEMTPLPPEEYTVTFIVTDINTSEPISEAQITIDDSFILSTDELGQATIDLPDGTYSYTVAASGYQNTNGSLTVNGADVTENVEMTPLPPEEYTVTFNVSEINTSDPISGAEIAIDGENLTTDASGQATISLPDETYSYSVTASGYENESGSVTVSGADVTENVEMTPLPPEEYTVTFNVSDINTSDPISGAEIAIDGENLTTDASGQATISLPDGTYSYSVNASGYENESGSVTVSGADVTENVEMTPLPPEEYTVTFNVSETESGEPIENATVDVEGEVLYTDSDGIVIFSLINGTYDYEVTAEGYLTEEGDFTVDGADVELDVILDFDIGIDDQDAANPLVLYPNPASENVTIEWENLFNHFTVKLRNVKGEIIFKRESNHAKSFEIDISTFAKGTYLVEINSENEVYRKKLIIK